MTKYTATAKQIGKSKNESITVNGEVFIKSCAIGKWDFVIVANFDTHSYLDDSLVGNVTVVESKHRNILSAENSAEKTYGIKMNHIGCNKNLTLEIVKVER